MKDSLLASNVAKAKGGAIYTSKSSIVIAHSTTFNGNRAGGTGDVVYGEG
jgi:predicted outer membrane repeat protein